MRIVWAIIILLWLCSKMVKVYIAMRSRWPYGAMLALFFLVGGALDDVG